jgi:dTDP-4-amino-4,6-dideoxy-D-galactose acyltransferase
MHQKVQKLDWDSDFFGFRVSMIKECRNESEWKNVFDSMLQDETHLGYYRSLEKLDLNDSTFQNAPYDIVLVDRKETFMKEAIHWEEDLSSIEVYDKPKPDQDLISLAMQAGVYSRFYVDEKVPREKYKELYMIWLGNAFVGELSKVFVRYIDGQLAGFITFEAKNGLACPGIMAVDPKFRGKGIARLFMKQVENWGFENNLSKIKFDVQGVNTNASDLYYSLGHELKSQDYFYHLWKK